MFGVENITGTSQTDGRGGRRFLSKKEAVCEEAERFPAIRLAAEVERAPTGRRGKERGGRQGNEGKGCTVTPEGSGDALSNGEVMC